MKLNEYLKKKNLQPIDFAKLIGCSIDAVYRWKRGKMPSNIYVKIIELTTNGAIKEKDWK